MPRLNDTTVRGLRMPQGQDRSEVWFDEKGLGIRLSKTGRKSWIYVYHYQERSRRITFGTYPTIGVADVRALHATAMHNLENGIDPGNAVQVLRAQTRSAPTVLELSTEYMVRHASMKKSGGEDQRMLNRDVLPYWGSLQAAKICRRDVTVLLDRIVERGALIAANRVLALIRKMFNFGIERSLIEGNPCDHVRQPAPNVQRDRILTQEEIRRLWTRLEDAQMSQASKIALKFQLVTAQRKGEIVNAEWSEVDFAARIWTIPAHKAKNGQAHRVYLTDLALEILNQLRNLAGDSRYWMPSPIGDKSMVQTSLDHALRKNLPLLDLENITPHDLRRTAASFMSSLGVPRLILSKILNHSDSSVTAIYDRHGYDQEKQEAWMLWSRRLQEIYERPLIQIESHPTASQSH
jgi:integrase